MPICFVHVGFAEVERQLKNFRDGFGFTRISKPTIIGDGIERLDDQQLQEMQLVKKKKQKIEY